MGRIVVGILIGFVVIFGCVLGGYMAMGGHLDVLMQPWELVIIGGAGVGTFLIANPLSTVKDAGKATVEAFKGAVPKEQDYLEVLGVLHSLMRELKTKSRNEVEAHIDNPQDSAIFQAYPKVLKNKDLTNFICDYCRIIIIGNARPFEIEALMDEEIHTIRHDKLKSYHALTVVGDAFPALGIVAAVLGIVKTMGSIDKPPSVLGGMIGSALVGTFMGVLLAYGIVNPLAGRLKQIIHADAAIYHVVKQIIIASLHGHPQPLVIEAARSGIAHKNQPGFAEVFDGLRGK